MKPDYLTTAEADVLAYAARYALARPGSTAPRSVVSELTRLWPRLRYWQQQQLHLEIRATEVR